MILCGRYMTYKGYFNNDDGYHLMMKQAFMQNYGTIDHVYRKKKQQPSYYLCWNNIKRN